MTEKDLKKKALLILKKAPDIFCWKVSDRFIIGLPDIVGCFKGKFFAIELKTEKGIVRPLQSFVLEKIKKSGGVAGICRNEKDLHFFLDNLKEGGDKSD